MREQFGFGESSLSQSNNQGYEPRNTSPNEPDIFENEAISPEQASKERRLTRLRSFELTGNRIDDGSRFLDLTNHNIDGERIQTLHGAWKEIHLYSELKWVDMARKLHHEYNPPADPDSFPAEGDEFGNLEEEILQRLLPQWQLSPEETESISAEFEAEVHQRIHAYEQAGVNLNDAINITYREAGHRIDLIPSAPSDIKKRIEATYDVIDKKVSLFQAMCRFHHRPFEGVNSRNLDMDGLVNLLRHFELIEGDLKRALEKIQDDIQTTLSEWEEALQGLSSPQNE